MGWINVFGKYPQGEVDMNCVNFQFLGQELIVFPHSLNKDTAFPSQMCDN